jgi:hypothetical protein
VGGATALVALICVPALYASKFHNQFDTLHTAYSSKDAMMLRAVANGAVNDMQPMALFFDAHRIRHTL